MRSNKPQKKRVTRYDIFLYETQCEVSQFNAAYHALCMAQEREELIKVQQAVITGTVSKTKKNNKKRKKKNASRKNAKADIINYEAQLMMFQNALTDAETAY